VSETRGDDAQAYRRLADLISWMFYPERRPGLLGTADRIIGRVPAGSAELVRDGEGWLFVADGVPVERFSTPADALEVIPRHAFKAEQVIVTARIADLLFHSAVEEAEEGLRLYWQSLGHMVQSSPELAERGVIERSFLERILAVPLDDPVDFALATGLLDRSLRRSLAPIGLAISAAEAQVNEWAAVSGGWAGREDRQPLVKKLAILAEKWGAPLDSGGPPLDELQEVVAFRNDVIHPNAIPQDVELGGTEAPGRGPSVQARRTCFVVRSSLITVAHAAGLPSPDYLKYCPPGPYEDDEVWRGAVLMTGAREDPEFPRASRSAES
jgi:hypothetical protein